MIRITITALMMAIGLSCYGQTATLRKFGHYDVATHGTPNTALTLARAQVSLSSLVATGTTATATSSGSHQYQVGESVWVSGANQYQYNGQVKVTSVAATNVFTYTLSSAPSVTTATGTLVANQTNTVESVLLYNPGTNAITIGPNSTAAFYSLGAGETYEVPITKKEGRITLSDWYSKSAVASQTVRVLFF